MSAKRAARAPSIFLHARAPHAHPHSFPTRRSSDLLGAAARAQELQEQLFKVELLTARWAVLEVLAKLPLELRSELAVQKFVEMLDALAAIHAGLPLMYPISTD